MKHVKLVLWLLVAVTSVTAHAATEHLRIMTYNVPKGNIKVTDGNGRNTWENRCLAIHQYLTDVKPDILGMQEPVRVSLCDILKGISPYAMVGTGRDDGAEGGEYTPIIYRTDRLRVLASGNYWLTDTPDEHSRVEGSTHFRIATWAFMENYISGARFLVTNTHLSYDSEPVRLAQIKVIKQHMQGLHEKYGKDLPHFFTGDFNMQDSEENFTYVLNWKVLLKDAWNSTRDHYHYATGNQKPSGRIDYIYATRNVTVSKVRWDNRKTPDGFWMSDHDPLWADVSFTTGVEDDARAAMAEAWSEVDSVYAYSITRNRLINIASQLTSDGMEPAYPMQNAIDLNTDTYIHSIYSTLPASQPHYLQVDLRRDDVENFRFTYYRRAENNEYGKGDRWKDLMITASEDGETWNYICHLHDFGGEVARSYSSDNIALRRPYRYVRFHVLQTPGEHLRNGHPQFSLSEFQMYTSEVASNSLYASSDEVRQAVEELKTLIASVDALVQAGTVTRAHVTQLQAGVEHLRQVRATVTSVTAPSVDGAANRPVFNLNGQRVPHTYKGVQVENGRKVLY